MFQETYRHMMQSVRPSEQLVEETARVGRARRTHRRGRAALAAALALCLCLALPALGAQVRPIHDLMYLVSPAVAQWFVPVEKSCVSSGIAMELVAARLEGDTAQFYITLRDLEGDRLDESVDLFDSYDLLRPFDSTGTCEMVGWEEAGGTATFLVTLQTMDGSDIPGGKVTFRLAELLTGQETYEDLTVPVDWAHVGRGDSALRETLGGGGPAYQDHVSGDTARVLIPGTPMEAFPVEGMDLTGIGYVDGLLHIQTQVQDPLSGDSHGYFWLEMEDGGTVESLYNVYTTNGREGAERTDWVDQVFDIDPGTLAGCTLKGSFVSGGTVIEGDWSITFPLEEMQ